MEALEPDKLQHRTKCLLSGQSEDLGAGGGRWRRGGGLCPEAQQELVAVWPWRRSCGGTAAMQQHLVAVWRRMAPGAWGHSGCRLDRWGRA
eukprot:212838-Chlamydomonas_euryale.AAC.1